MHFASPGCLWTSRISGCGPRRAFRISRSPACHKRHPSVRGDRGFPAGDGAEERVGGNAGHCMEKPPAAAGGPDLIAGPRYK